MTPAISVIIPTFRREEALCQMLRTLLAQDVDDFEILLIDQTPTHNEETTLYLSANEGRIRRIFQETPNLPMARNNGMLLARGAYIVFIDDDVLLPADCIRRLITILSRRLADGVTGLVNFDKSDEDLRQQYGLAKKRTKAELLYVNQFIGAVMAFRREVFDSIGGFDERLGVLSTTAAGEDYEFCRRATRARFRLAIDPTVVIQHPTGVGGGCAARESSPDVARMRQIRSCFYIEMKLAERRGRIGIQGWVRMFRGWAINRAMIKQGIISIFGNLRQLRKQYKIVRAFYVTGSR